ncbi:MAG TPA: RNA polymerase sigma factor [Candidatus Paceibacterota bacterium]|nr:RNA polymerase sigma factor [Candidatus Paceibacterota bacterium]
MNEMLNQKTDEELAALVQGKNEAAFGVLMSRYQPKLLRYGRKFLSDNAPIEDVVQEVFIKTYQNILGYDAARPFSPWIYRIAHNMFVNTLRHNSRHPLITVDLDLFSAHAAYERDPAEDEEREHMRALVDRGLNALPPIYREVVVLYYLEQLGYQEIADVLHVPVGTVGIRLRRAREAIKKYVAGE